MDYSWLHDIDDGGESSADSETDTEEAKAELEARLYAIVHHNDLSQPLPPDLAKHYTVHCDDSGELVVSLNKSLEEVKTEEFKNVVQLLKNPEPVEEVESVSESVIVLDAVEIQKTQPHKRFRYSDVNVDDVHSDFQQNKVELTSPEIPDNINFFKIPKRFFTQEKNEEFINLNIPLLKWFDDNDWKSHSNASFISIGPNGNPEKLNIVKKMVQALKEQNPTETHRKLSKFANILYSKNLQAFKKRKRNQVRKEKKRNKAKAGKAYTTIDLRYEDQDNFFNHENQNKLAVSKPRIQNKNQLNGSISLNITPFKPDPQPLLVELDSSENEDTSVNDTDAYYRASTKSTRSDIPLKWTKKMIKFYTKVDKRKINLDTSDIMEALRKTSVADDWQIDPRDQAGYYKHTQQGQRGGRKCANCNEKGHFIRECNKPKKIPTCSLCGEYFHYAYNCPNKICLKCGVFLAGDGFGGECSTCCFSTFDYDVRCEKCGKADHRSVLCTDFWRSFHDTTEGEKKIPKKANENKRKFCCNCARQGHFSHNCPTLMYAGQQISPFVSNYSAQPSERGTAEIALSNLYSDIVNTEEADVFLQNLSNSTRAEIEFNQGERSFVFKISGTFDQCKRVKSEIEGFVNTRKRKRQEPMQKKKKKQRVR